MKRSKIAISWLEISLIAVLSITGMGTWLFINQQVEQIFQDEKPELEQIQQDAHLPEYKRELAFAQNELNENQAKLVEQRIELAGQTAKLQTLEKIYPQLASDASRQEASLPSDVLKSYQQARIDRSTAENLVRIFENKSNGLNALVVDRENAVIKAQDTASKAIKKAQIDYEWNKRKLALAWSVVVIAIITLIFFTILFFISIKRLNINFPIVFFGAVSIQVVLLGYQFFDVLGAASAGLFLLIIILMLLPRKL